nr:sulfite exporter TauE/SafE family protein [Propionicimonas sp.]
MFTSGVMGSLPAWGWVVLALCALLAGFSTTAISGVAMLVVVLAAMVLPAKDSTGVALLIFLVGGAVAAWTYRRSVDWRLIGRLVVPVLVGIGLGALFLSWVDGLVLKRTIGVMLLALLALGLWPNRLAAHTSGMGVAYGGLAGFATMVANAGGPPMNLYLLAAKYDKWRFLGTTAWFFLVVDLTKVPVLIALGIVRPDTALLAVVLAPLALLGAWLGRVTIAHLEQRTFERLVAVFVAISALGLVFL